MDSFVHLFVNMRLTIPVVLQECHHYMSCLSFLPRINSYSLLKTPENMSALILKTKAVLIK